MLQSILPLSGAEGKRSGVRLQGCCQVRGGRSRCAGLADAPVLVFLAFVVFSGVRLGEGAARYGMDIVPYWLEFVKEGWLLCKQTTDRGHPSSRIAGVLELVDRQVWAWRKGSVRVGIWRATDGRAALFRLLCQSTPELPLDRR